MDKVASKSGSKRIAQYRFLLIATALLLVVVCFPSPTFAAKRKILLQLSRLQQWADLSYDYKGNSYRSDSGNDRSSHQHQFEQAYHVGFDFSLLDYRLANGSFEVDLGTNEAIENNRAGSDNSAGFTLEYQLDLLAFERSVAPLNLSSSQRQERVSEPFTDSYDVTTTAYGLGVSLKNSIMPTQLNYYHNQNETSGLSLDRTQASDTLGLSSTFSTGDISRTSLNSRVTNTRSEFAGTAEAVEVDSYQLEGANLLQWGERSADNSLNSRYLYRRDTGSSDFRTIDWGEVLDLRLGKALRVGGDYSFSDSVSPRQERRRQKGGTWLEHKLYQSLTTRLSYGRVRDNGSDGDVYSWDSALNLSYHKTLPQNSRLSVNYKHSYTETDRNLLLQQLFVFGEPIALGFFDNFLANSDVLLGTVEVYSADRLIKFVEGVDYELRQVGRRTELYNLSGLILTEGTVSVDYFYRVDNSIEYSTTTNAVNASLSLFGQRYRLYGGISQSNQDLIDGETEVSPLNQQFMTQAGVEADWGEVSCGANYLYVDSSLSTETTTELFIDLRKDYRRGLLNIRLTDRYSVLEGKEGADSSATSDDSRNSVALTANFRRRLQRNMILNLNGRLLDYRGSNVSQNDVALGMLVEARWHKFELQLSSDVIWQIYDDSSTREDLFNLKIRRYF